MKRLMLVLFISFATLYAASSRVDSLQGGSSSGNGSGLSSDLSLFRGSVYDASDMLIFPHLANEYSNYLNFYNAGTMNGFASFKVLDMFTLGFADMNNERVLQGLSSEGVELPAEHTYSFFIAYPMDNMVFGFAFNYWGNTNDSERTTDNNGNIAKVNSTQNIGLYDIKLSMGMTLDTNSGFDALLRFGFGGYTNSQFVTGLNPEIQELSESDGVFSVSIASRYYMMLSEQVKLTSWLSFAYGSESWKDARYDGGGTKINDNLNSSPSMNVNLGTGFEIVTPLKDLVVTPSIGISYNSMSGKTESLIDAAAGSYNEVSLASLTLPYLGLSVEYNILSWLTIYSGVSKIVNLNSTTTTTETKANGTTTFKNEEVVSTSESNTGFTLGFSLHSKSLEFIVLFNNAVVRNTPNFMFDTEGEPNILSATFQYNFGGAPKTNILPFNKVEKVEVKKDVKKEVKKEEKKEVKKVEKKVEKKDELEENDDDDLSLDDDDDLNLED